MAIAVIAFTATIPAGTTFPATHTVSLNVGTNDVDKIRWRVPPGPRGHLSWFLAMGGVQVLPNQQGTAIVADNEFDDWQIDDLPNTGAWQLIGSNSGTFDHSIYLEFFTLPVVLGDTGGGDILAGFPTTDAQLAALWSGGGGGILA
jgi:hypothetical protein